MAHSLEKHWQAHGLECVVVALDAGHRCGYVGVPKGHPLHGKGYDECDDGLDVHGGLTYANGDGKFPIGLADTWWFGFDCAHLGDAKDPSIMDETHKDLERRFSLSFGGEIRTLDYCISECERLAEQMAKAKEDTK